MRELRAQCRKANIVVSCPDPYSNVRREKGSRTCGATNQIASLLIITNSKTRNPYAKIHAARYHVRVLAYYALILHMRGMMGKVVSPARPFTERKGLAGETKPDKMFASLSCNFNNKLRTVLTGYVLSWQVLSFDTKTVTRLEIAAK